MNTYRELVYIVLDEIKSKSDDSFFTEEHIIFLLRKYRTFLLKQRYSDIKKSIPESNYQTICIDLIKTNVADNMICDSGIYLKSKNKIPYLMKIGNPMVYPIDYYVGNITYISRERMRYVGYNKSLQNIIYASLGPDNYLYLKSSNPQYLYLSKVKITGIFEDISTASELQCNEDNNTVCDILDMQFPIEDALIPPLVELIVKELLGAEYRPADERNDANDNLSDLASFINRNTKSEISKALQ